MIEQSECLSRHTICALATAPGGALGIIRISGPQALEILSRIFSKNLATVDANTVHYGRILSPPPSQREEGDATPSLVGAGEIPVDEVLVTVFHAPHSYTGEDSAEINCHGSRYILNKVIELLIQQGCRMAGPGEFTQRAYLNGKMDLSQAEAVADLIASNNRATHHLAMSQLRGGISTKLEQLRDHLLKLTSLLELELDFSDHEDLEFADRTELLQLAQQIDARIRRLVDSFQTGNAIKQGIPVAIIGAPNVGKSTLLNALLGEERAIVSDIQGTTRDAIEDTINLGGITFRFIDTAGIRHTSDQIEQMGIERSLQAAQRARIIILMTEPGVPYPDIETTDIQTVIRIENKIDLEGYNKPVLAQKGNLYKAELSRETTAQSAGTTLQSGSTKRNYNYQTLSISAKYGVGLNALKQQLIASIPEVDNDDVIITNARHYEGLCRAQENLSRVIEGIKTNMSGDLLSEDLRLVLSDLAEITGKGQITTNEVLSNIFKHFCVGK